MYHRFLSFINKTVSFVSNIFVTTVQKPQALCITYFVNMLLITLTLICPVLACASMLTRAQDQIYRSEINNN